MIHDAQLFISGDVSIHPTAAIAPGVLLQADPGCRLAIAAGVSVGIGSILHAYQGDLVVEAGATLGSGVLVVGAGTIGPHACIGSATTLFNQSIEAGQLVPAGALVGDSSRQIDLTEQVGEFVEPEPPAPTQNPADRSPSQPPASQPDTSQPAAQVVYGRAYIEKFMVTMFPHRQTAFSSEDSSE